MALFTRTPETWTPEGTRVSQRYRALEGATVLVYTADAGRAAAYYAVACLGCTYRADQNSSRRPMSETEAAQTANTHAAACRAMPRGVPARPDDTEAADLVRTRLWRCRTYSSHTIPVHISDFTALRVDLQRTTDWIKQQLAVLAAAEPDFLTATPAASGTRFTVQPHPART
ncbi:hypothetical protein [Streptomyces globosus]|uniref:hypothetical protein n=1 Tax=Streptomyces globosus TaxID=68209 RepID=UPI0031E2E2C6